MIEQLKQLLRDQDFNDVGERVFADEIPQGAAYPCLVLKKTATDNMNTLEGIDGFRQATVSIFCLDLEDKNQVDAIADAVEEFLDGYVGPMRVDELGDPEDDSLFVKAAILTDRDDESFNDADAGDVDVVSTRIEALIQFDTAA